MSKEKSPGEYLGKYMVIAIVSLPILCLFKWIWPDCLPFNVFEPWYKWNILGGILASWPIFLWVILVNLVSSPGKTDLVVGFAESAAAGLIEEPVFRWVIFYTEIILAKIFNWLLFGWLAECLELPRLFYWYIVGPCANLATLHFMEWLLYDQGWAVGAGTIAAVASFRNGHEYLGIFGTINSWYIGLFLFYIMFSYGLPAAIVVHFAYDYLIHVAAAMRVK